MAWMGHDFAKEFSFFNKQVLAPKGRTKPLYSIDNRTQYNEWEWLMFQPSKKSTWHPVCNSINNAYAMTSPNNDGICIFPSTFPFEGAEPLTHPYIGSKLPGTGACRQNRLEGYTPNEYCGYSMSL